MRGRWGKARADARTRGARRGSRTRAGWRTRNLRSGRSFFDPVRFSAKVSRFLDRSFTDPPHRLADRFVTGDRSAEVDRRFLSTIGGIPITFCLIYAVYRPHEGGNRLIGGSERDAQKGYVFRFPEASLKKREASTTIT